MASRAWQTRTYCCGHIVADTNVSPFARARNICCGHKFCVRDTRNVSDFVQKHFVSATNVSHGNSTFILCPARLRAQETPLVTMCPQLNVSSFARAFLKADVQNPGVGELLYHEKVEECSWSGVQIKDSGLTYRVLTTKHHHF